MGLFQSLFGTNESNQSQEDYQNALNAFNSVTTPELSALQVQLNNYVNAGQLSPEAAETALLNSNAFNQIATNPQYVGAQQQALQQLQQTAQEGGLTPEDKAQLQDITNQQNQQVQSQNAAVMQQAQQRGTGGSNLNTVAQLINNQNAANTASQQGVNVAAQAQGRALQALQSAGQLGGQMQSQAYGQAANQAQAQNAINQFNAQTSNQANLYNTQVANQAQAANLQNAQNIANANTQTQNQQAQYNAQQNQTQYEDALQKAQGIGNIYGTEANQAQQAANQQYGANVGLVGGLFQGGAKALGSAFGGPIGGAIAGQAIGGGNTMNPNYQNENAAGGFPSYAEGGEVNDPEHPDHMAMGGHVHCYNHGGESYHHPDCYMAKGGFLSGLKKGALHKSLGVPEGEKIPSKKIEKATHSDNELLRKRAQFAENAKQWHHADGGEINPNATVEASSDTARIPAAVQPDQAEKKEDKRTFIEKLGSLLGSHADQANEILNQANGGEIDYRKGGPVPGKAEVDGDDEKNDIVDAKLSPGEVVIPRSAQGDEEKFEEFMKSLPRDPRQTKPKFAVGGIAGIPKIGTTPKAIAMPKVPMPKTFVSDTPSALPNPTGVRLPNTSTKIVSRALRNLSSPVRPIEEEDLEKRK